MDDNKKTSQLDKMLTIEDIMEHLHISNTTAYKLVEMNSFPSLRIGRKWLIPESEYKKWLKKAYGTEIIL
ncbi:helix-turn-helix domain-containing protein [Eubacterium sp. LFL-14]|mgnify:CR=1 FL=1|jgi:excisionase family DNA binding protein|uniref:Helix-turn-helix domain-containing protein n=1 Tax=Eubacterium album TaxID=2978477 RepID=A0ABT2LWM0_9FIRM|nr:helix-turn-helix domain-containing protein [Eubacterium sp. LFL-14]MCT7397674.1 helix-turn-helix domain-containing protein [Eubacterium sp. LFL-14]